MEIMLFAFCIVLMINIVLSVKYVTYTIKNNNKEYVKYILSTFLVFFIGVFLLIYFIGVKNEGNKI